MLIIRPIISWKRPKRQFPNAVENVDTMSTLRGTCSPNVIKLKVAFTWKIPPIVHPNNIVIKMFAMRDPKFYKKRKLMPTEKNIIRTFLSLNIIVSIFKHLLSSDWSTPNLAHVALSYIIIFPTKYEPNIDANSKSIAM